MLRLTEVISDESIVQ